MFIQIELLFHMKLTRRINLDVYIGDQRPLWCAVPLLTTGALDAPQQRPLLASGGHEASEEFLCLPRENLHRH